MAFVTDPDDLDRFQVAVNPETERVSIRGLGVPDVDFGNIPTFSTAQSFTSEQLNTDAVHSLETGDPVFYADDGGSENVGLTDLTTYWVNVVDTDTVTMHLDRAAAIAGTSAINLTTSGAETHELRTGKVTTAAVTFAAGDASLTAVTKVTFDSQDLSTAAANDQITIVSGGDIGHYTIATIDDGNDFIIVNGTLAANDQLVTDGDMPDNTNWTEGAGWTVSSGATSDGSSGTLTQTLSNSPLLDSTVYEVTYEITAFTGGTVAVDLGAGTPGASNGSQAVFTERLTTSATADQDINFISSSFDGTISNVMVTELVTAKISDGTSGAEITGSEGGTVADGVSMQALYSFLKEEWRTLASTTIPDLIKFTFPLESITREQFEIGGPTHSNWDFEDATTRNLLRTGGWTSLNLGNEVLDIYPGIVTLGSLDTDTQVYFIQTDSFTASPTDFILTGPVNQAINALNVTGGFDTNKDPVGEIPLVAQRTASTNKLIFTTSTIQDDSSTEGDFTAAGYVIGDKVQIIGAEDTGNVGFFAITDITTTTTADDTLTVSGTLIANTDDTSARLSPITDNRAFLKLFARKKARTYVTSTNTDIGVTTIGSIVNRFPLSHVADPAITFDDGEIAGDPANTVFGTVSAVDTGDHDDGDVTSQGDGTFLFDSTAGTFTTDNIQVGDTLEIDTIGTGGNAADVGFYEILSVESETQLSCFEEPLNATIGTVSATDTGYKTYTKYRSQPVTDGVMSDPTPDDNEGRITSAGSTFSSDGVLAGDLVVITGGHAIPNPGGSGIDFLTNVITDIDSTTNFTAEGFIVGDRITLASAEDAENNGTYVIIDISATDDVLIVQNTDGTTVSFTTNTADTAVTFTQDNFIGVYKVATGGVATTTLDVDLLDPDDHFATSANATSVNLHVLQKGMALEYREKIASPSIADGSGLAFTTSTIQRVALPDWETENYVVGGTITIAAAEDSGNIGTFIITTVATDTITCITTAGGATPFTVNTADTTATTTGTSGHVRVLNGTSYSFNWRLFGNSGTLAQCFQYIQRQLRRGRSGETLAESDIDTSQLQFRGDISDLLMAFSSPTGTTFNMYIDELASTDLNNATKEDITGSSRNFAFIAAITINLNDNILSAATSKVVIFFSDPDVNAGSPITGNEFGTVGAIIVADDVPTDMESLDPAASPLTFNFDFDNNAQGGRSPSGDQAASGTPITIVSISTTVAQYVQTTGFILRQSSNIFSLVAALERNYSNP